MTLYSVLFRSIIWPVALVFVLHGSHANVLAESDYELEVGKSHPDFNLPDIEDGRPVSLRQYRGQKVLLIQFASW